MGKNRSLELSTSKPQTLAKDRIPKLVMQTWKTKDVPEQWKAGYASISRLNPSWNHVLMTDEDNRNFIVENFPQYLSLYDGFEYNIERVDFVRYAWLYVKGGVYIDLDYEMYAPFEEIIDMGPQDGNVYLLDGSAYQSTNAFMISEPKCEFWLRVMEEIAKDNVPWYYRLEKHLYILHATGPGVLLKVANSYDGPNKLRKLPTEAFPVCSACEKEFATFSAKKLEGTSWVSGAGRLYLFVFCNFYTILIILLILLIVLLIWWFRKK